MKTSEPAWKPKHGTKTVQWFRPQLPGYGSSCFVVSVMPRRKKFVWLCHRDYFGLQGEGLADTIEQAKADALAFADKAYRDLSRAIEEEIHPTELVSFACKKLGLTEEALTAEYRAHREKKKETADRRFAEYMLRERPDLVLETIEEGGRLGALTQEQVEGARQAIAELQKTNLGTA